MATFKIHPNVSDYHVTFDVNRYSEPERLKMLRRYEGGSVVLLAGCDLGLDFDLFDRIDIAPHPKTFVHYLIAKLSTVDYLDMLWGSEPELREFTRPKRAAHALPEREAGYQELKAYLRAEAFKSPELRVRLVRQILEFEKRVLSFYSTIFPEYDYYKYSINWRLTESRKEFLHVDAYETERDFHQVKLFINLDTAPRIWNTGELMRILVERHLEDRGLRDRFREKPDQDYHRFLEECNAALLDVKSGPVDCHQTHTMFFDRGDTWIAETRHIPHQIVFGRKMVSVQFYMSPERRVAPELSMASFVHGLREPAPPNPVQ